MVLSILGKAVKVSRVKLDDGDYGDYKDMNIRINSSLTCPELIRSTLLHEVMHAVLDITGHSHRFRENDEEAIVYALENGIYPLLKKITEYTK